MKTLTTFRYFRPAVYPFIFLIWGAFWVWVGWFIIYRAWGEKIALWVMGG